jgi:hypothetical protein
MIALRGVLEDGDVAASSASRLRSRFAAIRVRPAHRDYWRREPYPEEWFLMEWPKGEEQPPNTGSLTYDGLAPSEVGLYQFNVTVPNIASSDTTPVTFTLGGVAGTQTLYIAIQSGNTGAQVQGLTLSPTSVGGGGTVQGTVALSEPAPAGGAIVALSSSSSAATVPSTVTVPAAATSATFTISTDTVSSNQAVTITATYGGSSAQAALTVIEAASTAQVKNLTVEVLDFFPTGYPSISVELLVNLNPDNVTYTALLGPYSLTFLNGVASNQNQTFTFTTIETGPEINAAISFPGTPTVTLLASSASLTFTLTPGPVGVTGNLAGTLSITGMFVGSTSSVTVSGPVTGKYSALLSGEFMTL